MDLDVHVGDDTDPEATHSLYRWLCVDDDVSRAGAEISRPDRGGPGHLGALEVINVVLGNSIALGALVVAVAGWRGSRSRSPVVRLEYNGVQVEIEGGAPAEVRQIVGVLTASAATGTNPCQGAETIGDPGPGHDGGESV